MHKNDVFLVALTVVALVVIGAIYVAKNAAYPVVLPVVNSTQQVAAVSSQGPKTYRNGQYSFEFVYPAALANPAVGDNGRINGLTCNFWGYFYDQQAFTGNGNSGKGLAPAATFCVTADKTIPSSVSLKYDLGAKGQLVFWGDKLSGTGLVDSIKASFKSVSR